MRNNLFQLITICFLAIVTTNTFAQNQKTIDQIVAVVGNKIVLASDVEVQYLQGKHKA